MRRIDLGVKRRGKSPERKRGEQGKYGKGMLKWGTRGTVNLPNRGRKKGTKDQL